MPDRLNPGVRRGLQIAALSLALGALSWLPLLGSIAFAPPDANPIGFGLLMFFGTIAAAVGVLIGGAWAALSWGRARR